MPSWLRNQSRRLFAMSAGADEGQSEVLGVYTSISPSSSEHNELGFSILDGVESGTADPVAVEKFRTTFALDEKETLIAGVSFPMNTVLSVLTLILYRVSGIFIPRPASLWQGGHLDELLLLQVLSSPNQDEGMYSMNYSMLFADRSEDDDSVARHSRDGEAEGVSFRSPWSRRRYKGS